MILEKFYTDNYNNQITLRNEGKEISLHELKQYIYAQKLEFEKEITKTVILFGDSSFDFIVNFFAALFANKSIYLLTDKTRLNNIDCNYILPKQTTKAENYSFDKINPKETQIIFYTSGSTSEPKKITKTFYNLIKEAESAIHQFNIKKDLNVYSTTVMTHMFGLTFFFMVPMYLGQIINTTKIEFPEQIVKDEPYILVSSPSFLEKMEKYEINFQYPASTIFTAGAKLKDNVQKFFAKNSNIIEIYGSTEAGTIAYKNNTKNFKVFDAVNISTDENNCIIVKSDFFIEEKLKMEDIIEKISDKEFILKERSDRIVKIKEKRISLVEIETILKKYPDIIDCYCFKYQDVLACAVATKNSNLTDKELKKYLSEYSEIVPKRWRFLDEIPKTVTGKVDKNLIERIFNLNLSYPFILSRKINENNAEIEMIFKSNSNFFKGHFSIMPILPGVVQLFYANWFAQNVFKINLSKKEAKKIKFTNIIHADKKVTLKLKNTEKNIEYTYTIDDKIYSSGLFVKEDNNEI